MAGHDRGRGGLSRTGTWRAIERLVAERIVLRAGIEYGGTSFPVELNHRHPLGPDLKALFAREALLQRFADHG